MRGEFDDQLKWPFRGNITIRLVNQEDKDNILKTIRFTEKTPQMRCQRVMTDEPSSGCAGFHLGFLSRGGKRDNSRVKGGQDYSMFFHP